MLEELEETGVREVGGTEVGGSDRLIISANNVATARRIGMMLTAKPAEL